MISEQNNEIAGVAFTLIFLLLVGSGCGNNLYSYVREIVRCVLVNELAWTRMGSASLAVLASGLTTRARIL